MCRIYIDRTIVIKSRIESHPRTHTSAFHLTFRIDLTGHGMPSQMSDRSISNGINPAFIDSMRQTVYVNSRSRRLQIRIIPVEQLMPKPFSTLQGSHPAYMSPEIIHHFRTLGVIFRQYIEQFACCQHSPPIGTRPTKGRMIGTAFYPSMTIQSFFRDKHTVGKLQELSDSLRQIYLFLSLVITAHLGYCGNPHKHVVQPKCIMLRTIAGKSTICQSVFFILNKIKIVLN